MSTPNPPTPFGYIPGVSQQLPRSSFVHLETLREQTSSFFNHSTISRDETQGSANKEDRLVALRSQGQLTSPTPAAVGTMPLPSPGSMPVPVNATSTAKSKRSPRSRRIAERAKQRGSDREFSPSDLASSSSSILWGDQSESGSDEDKHGTDSGQFKFRQGRYSRH
jgi:hypothetical protein